MKYEILDQIVEVDDAELDAKVEAIRREPGTLQDKLAKHFADVVMIEPADPLETPADRQRLFPSSSVAS